MKKLAAATTKRIVSRKLFVLAGLLASIVGAGPVCAALPPAVPGEMGTEAPASSATVRKFVSDAQRALKSGDFRLAIILLKNAVAAAPNNGMVHAQLGTLLLQTGDPASAEHELRQARGNGAPDQAVLPALFQALLEQHKEEQLLNEFPDPGTANPGPSGSDILKARAIALQSLGRGSEAAAAMDRSLSLRRDIAGLLARARIAEQQNNVPLAKNLSDEALKLDPKRNDALLFKLGLLMLSNETSGALALSNQLIEQNPNSPAPRLARIEILLKLKQDSKAKLDVDAILTKAPNAPIGLYYKALLLARANNVKAAWQIAQSLPPEFTQSQPSIAIMVSQMAISSGRTETGAAILTATIAKHPDLLDLRLRLAAVRLRQNSPEAALSTLAPVKDSSDPRVLALLSQTYLKLGRFSDALTLLNKLNTSGSASSGLQRELALVEMRAGQSDQAIKDLLALAAKQPTDPTVVVPLVAALMQAKRFPEAIAAADRLAADPKQRVQSHFLHGQILVLQGNSDGALAEFQKALQLDPKNVVTLYYRSGLYELLGKTAEATKDLQTILSVDPKNVAALVKMAELEARQNHDKNVRNLLAQASSFAPKDPTPRLALARYLVAHHDAKGALISANAALGLQPNNADALALVGELQLGLGQKKDAITSFRNLTQLLPKLAKPQLLLANVLFANGDRASAAAALKTAAALEPKSGDVRAAQINLLFAQNDSNGAIAAARAYQTAYPGTPADLLLADTLVRAHQPDKASDVLAKTHAVSSDARVLLRLVQLETASGNRKKAESQMANWLTSHDRDVAVREQYATFLMQDGQGKEAVAQFETVLRLDPNNVAALNNLGWMLQLSDPKRALSLLSLAYKIAPDLVDVADSLGWVKLQAKDYKGALELLNKAHSNRPKDGEITYHLVVALDASGNRPAAKGLLKALLSSGAKFDDLAKAQKLAAAWH